MTRSAATRFYLLLWISLVTASPVRDVGLLKASSFAGSPTSFVFPPPGVTATIPDPNFPDATGVNVFGPTPTGDEAAAIETAPVLAKVDTSFPLVQPNTSDHASHKFNVLHHLGNLSPMFSNEPGAFGLPNASPLVPKECQLKQVHLVHRHGARYPTTGTGAGPAALAEKIHSVASGPGFDAKGALNFLNEWTYRLGAEILTPFGREQLYNLGVGFRVRYGDLLKGFDDLPVFRTTSQERMVDSALQFAAGFFGVQSYQTSYHQLVEIEKHGFNSTLSPYWSCPNAFELVGPDGNTQAAKWADIYTKPIIRRLSKDLKGLNLTEPDVVAMQQLCAYETVALGYSAFCNLFTEKEWEHFEYYDALTFWYGFGPGGAATAAQGVGWLQEFVSRLTKTRITSFVFVALNLTSLAEGGPLPTDHVPDKRSWYTSQIIPFATNLAAQVMSCSGSEEPSHIRFLLNDAVVPLAGLEGCRKNKNGFCKLDDFITGIQKRIDEIDYTWDCFGNYTIPDPNTIIDGRAPRSTRKAMVEPTQQVTVDEYDVQSKLGRVFGFMGAFEELMRMVLH
ncbi:hypothetical protein EWM64_g4792 [Hericium alpestre]|uniref:3-phytase n=1 Tax=Hericium alpestre TaxID=135208 RepID=A0A4Z0A0J4_9AGAM|nr:hypothetical protein EWM64_g4792 [Hericium alpestre]